MKLALYRKYRPSRFSEVVGQDDVVRALRNQLTAGKVGHAYIFTGIRGTGKTTLAKILAKAVNCPNARDGEPCGECEICRGIDNGSILDVTEMDAASNNRVDTVRDLLDETHYAPVMCRMRVYIVDEVHMMTASAFNALLKTIEEPPAHVMFIFATTEINKVPLTIRSRCQRFDLRRIPEDRIAQRLKYVAAQEGIDLRDDAADLIARLADGALRDALTLLDTCASLEEAVTADTVSRIAGITDKSYLFELSSLIRRGDCSGVIGTLQSLYHGGADARKLLTELTRHYRDLLMAGSGGVTLADCSAETQERYLSESRAFSVKELLHVLDTLATASDRMGKSLDADVALELAVLKLAGEKPQEDRAPAREIPAPKPAPAPVKEAPASAPAKEEPSPAPMKEEPSPVPEKEDLPPWEPDPAPASAPEERKPAPAAAPAREVSAPAEDGDWQKVIGIIKKKKLALGTMLRHSVPHLTDTHLLIEANDIAYKFIRENADSRQIIKDAYFEVTGLRRNIGPWKGEPSREEKPADDGLDAFLESAAKAGITVETKQEIE